MTDAELKRRIGALSGLGRAELVEHWHEYHADDPPKGASRSFLILAVSYEMQARRHGRLKPALRRRLESNADGTGSGDKPRAAPAPVLKLGTRLIREWNGVTHRVEVTDGGFLWNGASYASLSAVARAITGARWSGPRFFGLNGAGSS